MVRTWRRIDNSIYYAGQSIDYDPIPAVKEGDGKGRKRSIPDLRELEHALN